MKERCVIHIGMHKTGSSSIQSSLYKQLTDENFSYADLGGPNHTSRILQLFSEHPEKYKSNSTKSLSKGRKKLSRQIFEDELVQSFSQDKAANLIISGEGIYNLSVGELRKMQAFLSRYVKKIVIVGYVRSPISFIESSFQQKLKGGLNNFRIENSYPKYRQRFEKFDQVFGRENVELWKFDPKKFSEGNVVLDFCQRVGIIMEVENSLRVNDSLSQEAVSLLYSNNKFGAKVGYVANSIPENKALIDELCKIGKNKFKLSLSLMTPVLEKYREDIEWMENRLGNSLAEKRVDKATVIRNENDLLNNNPEIVKQLRELIGDEILQGKVEGNTAQKVAELVHMLRIKLTSPKNAKRVKNAKPVLITSLDIAKKIQQDKTKKFGNMNKKKVAKVISAALMQIKKEIRTTEENIVKIPEFGEFNIRKAGLKNERKKGAKVRTLFNIALD